MKISQQKQTSNRRIVERGDELVVLGSDVSTPGDRQQHENGWRIAASDRAHRQLLAFVFVSSVAMMLTGTLSSYSSCAT